MKTQSKLTLLLITLALIVGITTYFLVYSLTRSHIATIPFVGLMALAVCMAIISNVIFAKNAFKA